MSETGRPERTLALIPAILSGLILRRSGILAANDAAGGQKAPTKDDLGYETEDVHVGATWLIVAGLAVTVALSIAGLGLLMQRFSASQREALPPLTKQQTAKLSPPPPNLQPTPYADIDKMLAEEAARLRGYAYTDASRTRARIPIERAMTLTIGKPLDP